MELAKERHHQDKHGRSRRSRRCLKNNSLVYHFAEGMIVGLGELTERQQTTGFGTWGIIYNILF